MKLVDILDPGRIVFRLQSTRREDVLREITHLGLVPAEANTELGVADEDHIVHVLEEREKLGSTGITNGLAIPHGKLDRLDAMVACLAIAEGGIDYGALDGKPSHVFIVLLAPESAGGMHLKALARISRLFSDATLVPRLLQAANSEQVWDTIVDVDSKT